MLEREAHPGEDVRGTHTRWESERGAEVSGTFACSGVGKRGHLILVGLRPSWFSSWKPQISGRLRQLVDLEMEQDEERWWLVRDVTPWPSLEAQSFRSYNVYGLQGRWKDAWEKFHGFKQSPSDLMPRKSLAGARYFDDPYSYAYFSKCALFSLSLFFREAGHSACEKSVPSSPARSTLATSLPDNAAPNVWVSDCFQVKEQYHVF